MFKVPGAVYSWLSQVGNDRRIDSEYQDDDGVEATTARLRKKRRLEMATPSASAGRSSSPKKRKINTNNDGDSADPGLGNNSQPALSDRSGHSTVTTLSMRTTLPPSLPSLRDLAASTNPPSPASDRQERSSRGSRRSASPVKNLVGLKRLEKPVYFDSFPEDAGAGQLPDDMRQLYSNIYDAIEYKTGIYPAEIRTEIEEVNHSHPPPPWVFKQSRAHASEQTQEERYFDYFPLSFLCSSIAEDITVEAAIARAEFYKVCHIRDAARECLTLRRSEAAWNSKVHEPLLDLAFSTRRPPSVLFENATAARILPCFLPALGSGEAVDGKLVDFTLMPNLSPELDASIQDMLSQLIQKKGSTTVADLCINQTEYSPLLRYPVAVSIETKVAGASLEEGQLQLAIWTAAWHKRMEKFGFSGRNVPPLPTLPLILTHDHKWELYFAVDRVDKIEILGTMQIGMTDHLQGIYQLLTVLGQIGAWIDTTFRTWVVNSFHTQNT
ncbi:hypothetical protein B0T25DRAFT_360832 [Lasiosphaeria hispida]|uniref:PD-(D/E)XK nuclease-like domain-containing protein n=1 Tax=Lasiosphaeria hispida TaxID=260671 RepID=A0AAJ0H4X5_9PEZI|nr:hypothetical protein B0T25DRAFT_360832 [Lasiosphaeria hispida]